MIDFYFKSFKIFSYLIPFFKTDYCAKKRETKQSSLYYLNFSFIVINIFLKNVFYILTLPIKKNPLVARTTYNNNRFIYKVLYKEMMESFRYKEISTRPCLLSKFLFIILFQ